MGAIASNAAEEPAGPWNPGLKSQAPKEWRHLETIFRPENNFSTLAAAEELRGLTGFGLSELVVFRPERLALHELLIRVTADFVVPDGSRIGDLGINFRRIANRILTAYLQPEMRAITETFEEARRQVADAVDSALSDVLRAPPGQLAPRSEAARGAGPAALRLRLGCRPHRGVRATGGRRVRP